MNYINWMKEQGTEMDKITIKYFSKDYRGIIAKKLIQKKEDVIFVPKCAIISLRTAKNGKIGQQLVEKKVSLAYPNNSFLSTYVLSEIANPASKWKVIFDAFPKNVSNFPIFFTETELNLLTGSPFLSIFYNFLMK